MKRINGHLRADGTPKPGYTTWSRALAARFNLAARTGASLDAIEIYACRSCPQFHIGHHRPRKGTHADRTRT